ncbi:sulfatase family protein [Neorhodopirellula pilleata]|uniref:Arylsulfatase n=1 Tax=Neorhodopirellula pilleata TaxID=2714738 RepID=A0A5C6A071_9BACT|nr:sulfatase [Neorhodopirellula pilleata]TWT92588.1 Arylsulfatase [Neorhodopirellula pilleata]
MNRLCVGFLLFLACRALVPTEAATPNFLIITVDDMNCDSVGAFGCKLAETTPAIDRFAARSMRFQHAHVQVGNCYPSRNVMLSGRYPHNTGVEGFYQVKDADYPHLVDLMKGAGYFVGIRGKVSHSTPYQPYAWDADLTVIDGQTQDMKNAESYYRSTKRGIELADQQGKPFCLNVNISDPHKPFYATGKKSETIPDPNVPSRVFTPDEVPIPGFLFDHPDVRRELAQYYSSVRRADDCFAAVMNALQESGQEQETVVIFLSDHGMPLPFAKTALWNHSTRTPLMVRWPGVTKPGSVNETEMVSAVDLTPTIVDIVGIDPPDGFDGRSFAPVLHGQSQLDREMVYKIYNENSGGNRSPMRSVQSKRFGYLFNPWSDGKRVFKTATQGTLTYRAMNEMAKSDPLIAQRLALFQHGVPEEFYDYENDPDALHNLIDDPAYTDELKRHRQAMQQFMEQSGDPILPVFLNRDDDDARSEYVDQVQAQSDARRSNRKNPKPRQNQKLFSMSTPTLSQTGDTVSVEIHHDLPRSLSGQTFHVTLKDASGKRIERVLRTASGAGTIEVSFTIDSSVKTDSVSVSAFVGEEFSNNLLHRTEGPVKLIR